MFSELHSLIAQAVLADVDLDVIEETIIAPAALDDELNAALWLYAEALQARQLDAMIPGEREPALILT